MIRTSEVLAARCAADGEFRLASRYWNGGLRLVMGDHVVAVMVTEGAVSAGDPGEGEGVVTLTGSADLWDCLLAPVPAPYFHDVAPAQALGLVRSGPELTYWQYSPAIQRAVELLRDDPTGAGGGPAHLGTSARAPRSRTSGIEAETGEVRGRPVGGARADQPAVGFDSPVEGSDPESLLGFWDPQVSNETKARMMQGLTSPTSPEALREETIQTYAAGWPPAFLGDLRYYMVEFDLRERAADIDTAQVGVDILSGEYDYSASPAMGRAAHDAIAGSTFAEMKGLGHFPMSEDPEAFLVHLLPVLDAIAAGR